MIVAVLELEPEDLLHVAPHRVGVPEPGELPDPAPDADHAGVPVQDHERRVRRGVVVVEQLEQEAEPAPLAAAWTVAEAGGAVGRDAAVAAVGADEVRHREGESGRLEASGGG